MLSAIQHGRSLPELRDLRRPDGESYLKGAAELLALPPGEPSTAAADPVLARAWREGIAASAEIAAGCRVELTFERYRFPGFDVPKGETPFSHLSSLCWEGAKRRYHPFTPAVVRQLAHELDVIEKTGLAEFFLICWDLMRFAKSRKIPAQGRGSAADSIVAYVLGITRVDPIRHELLFERFINEGRTAYPDVDIDFSSERREEVIQYVYERYGTEHTGMVCNLVTYRARSAVREVGYALGFPRPLVDRVAKALETYDSVMVRRDLEAEGGFAQFFARPGRRPEMMGARGRPGARRRPRPDRRDGPAEPPARRPLRGCRPAAARLRLRGVVSPNRAPIRPGYRREALARPDRALGRRRCVQYSTRAYRDRAGRRRGEARRTMARGRRGGSLASGPGRGARARHRRGRYPGRDDKGGPGDSPVSVRWIREGPPSGPGAAARHGPRGRAPPRSGDRRPDGRGTAVRRARMDLPIGGPSALDRPIDRPGGIDLDDGGGPGDESAAARRWAREQVAMRADRSNSILRMPPQAELRPPGEHPHRGSVAGLSDWERWLELCARIDGFPRHLSIHSGGMLVTAAPLIDIAPIERATMKDRVVVQFDKRDVETMKLIKLDLLGLGMLAAIDECIQLIEHDCAVCLDLDHIPEEIPEVFEMLQAADTVGVFQVESRAQMQTLPKSRPQSLDDLVVEVAIIRPGPIQGNAVHPYLRRKQGIEPVVYLHPSLAPILRDTLGVILYQEQVMKIAIEVAGFTPAGSDGFRRAMGTWRSTREMEKLHEQFVEGCISVQGMPRDDAEELFRQCAAFASFGFAKSHAAAFARTAYESSFLKLFYPAQFVVGLVNAQPMGFYPVEVLVNDAKRHGVAVLPVDVNRSAWRTTTEWVGRPGWALAGADGDDGSHDGDPGEPLPDGCGIEARPAPVRSPACVIPGAASRDRWAAESMTGWGVRLGLHLVKGIGEEQEARLDAELARGPYTSLADVVERTGLAEEVVERLIRAGALDSLGRPRRELLWQLREVAGASKGRVDGRAVRGRGQGPGRRAADGPAPAGDRGAAAAADHRAGAAGRRLRGRRPRRAAPGGEPVPRGAGPAGGGDQRGPRRASAGPRPHRRPRRHPPAPDDRARHGVPGARGRDRHGQRHALAGHLAAAPVGGPAARAAARRRRPPAGGERRQRHRAVGHAARRGGGDGRRPVSPAGVRQIGHAGMRRMG